MSNWPTMSGVWNSTRFDEEIAQELQSFLPSRMFDAHAHVYCVRHQTPPRQSGPLGTGPGIVGIDVWRKHMAQQVGDNRCRDGLFFPDPVIRPECLEDANHFLLTQLEEHPGCRGLLLVSPRQTVDAIGPLADHPQIAGFKVYHTFSRQQPTTGAAVETFLPDQVWDLCHRLGALIMLHLVRDKALADPLNQRYLRDMCQRWPNARLVLAHAGRGFRARNTIEGAASLRGLDNVWFDSSVVCESEALLPVLDHFGPRKLLWGSDFPVSQMRGRCVSIGDGFTWLDGDTRLDVGEKPTQVGLESLRALQIACERFGCSAEDLQSIFHDNAIDLLGIATPPPRDRSLYKRARSRIPGGTQLLSKRPELNAPEQWPAYFREARGCEIWDIDGRHFFDMSTGGIGSCLLGFRDPDVTRAVQRRVALGSMCSLNPPEEVELAERLCAIHPWADVARFTRGGGEAMAVAARIARATTGRSLIAVCGYHGWHDWYLATNLQGVDQLEEHLLKGLEPAGVPEQLAGTTVTFGFNRADQLEAILDQCGDQLAAVVIEPCRFRLPEPGFLETVGRRARQHGAILILDEITAGWRLCPGGAHLELGVNPDIAVFAKALGNGHPIAAVIGTSAAMQGADRSFISSTYWTESIGPVAALATIDKMQSVNVPAHIHPLAGKVAGLWQQHARAHDLPVSANDNATGLVRMAFEHDSADIMRTLYTQWMLDYGFLAGTVFYPTLAHDEEIVARYGIAIESVFRRLAGGLEAGTLLKQLRGPVACNPMDRLHHPGPDTAGGIGQTTRSENASNP